MSKIVINTLAKNTFKYQNTLNDKIVLSITITASYIFKLLTDFQYNDIKFKRLLINSSVLIWLVDSIS